MTFREAESFLSHTNIDNSHPSRWADFGCGNGLFTKVLSGRLADGSVVHAIDKSRQSLTDPVNKEVNIIFQQADFVRDELSISQLDGILMANSLHYVQDKETFLQKMKQHLLPDADFLIIEYDTINSNRWVPYPVPFSSLPDLFKKAGYTSIQKTAERASLYQSGKMYAALIKP